MSPLVPCPSCVRHVRSSEASCPFCKSALPTGLATRAVPAAPRRLDRLAAFTFAASLAVAACGGKSVDPITGTGSEEVIGKDGDKKDDGKKDFDDDFGGAQPSYGAPAPPWDPPMDAGVAPMYGMPAPEVDGGATAPMYGMPAPAVDAGYAAMYGMPPQP